MNATRQSKNGPTAANGTMAASVEALLADAGPLDPARAILAASARRLAMTLDAMDAETAARLAAQTAGALTRTLDRLGLLPQGGQPSPAAPQQDGEPGGRDGDTRYPGIEDDLASEEIGWRIAQHARKTGLPVPGTPQYGRDPWADNVLNEEHPYGKRMRIRGRRAWFVGGAADRQPLHLASPDG